MAEIPGIFSVSYTDRLLRKVCLISAMIKWVQIAVHTWMLTAFSERPHSFFVVRFCFVHLKNTSICHLFLYIFAISRAETSWLLVRKYNVIFFPLSWYSTNLSGSGYHFLDLYPLRRTVLSFLRPVSMFML